MSKSEVLTRKLEDIVDIQSGYQLKGQMTNAPEGNVSCIQVQDLDHSQRIVKSDGLWKIKTDKIFDNYQITKNDLLFLSKGSKFGAYRIPDFESLTIPLAHFFILRTGKNNKVNSTYLWWILNERRTANKIQNGMKGSMMPFISRADLGQIEIPIPPRDVQEMIFELANLRLKEKDLVTKIEIYKDQLIENALANKVFGEKL